MANPISILNTNTNFNNYYATNSISNDAQCKLTTTDFVVVPTEYKDNEFFFAQESISFIKFCRQNDPDHSYDLLADHDIQVRSLHSFDIWMPVIWVASSILLPFAINMVSSYVYDKLKGREKEDAKVDVTFIVKRDHEEKTIHYSGDARTFKESFEKIDLNNM
jgi:hypothetical protein